MTKVKNKNFGVEIKRKEEQEEEQRIVKCRYEKKKKNFGRGE